MQRTITRLLSKLKYACAGFLLLLSPTAFADYKLNLTQGVTKISHDVYDLHMVIFYICVVIGILVFGVMFYALLKHRKSRGHEAVFFHENTKIEILWTLIPLVILIGMAIPATIVLLEMEDTGNSEISIKVTGYQWKWQYHYLDDDVTFFSNLKTSTEEQQNLVPKGEHYLREVDNHVVVPVGKKIRFLFTANDVIHSWWVPDLAIKKDTIPGFINENWTVIDKPGIYRGQCAELCGLNHGFMPIVVEAVSQEDYQKWITDKKTQAAAEKELASKVWTKDELVTKGEEVYTRVCVACHQANGQGLPPMFPALKDGPIVMGDINKHVETVLWGVKGTAMQSFAAQMSETDIAAVVTYERNSWGNNKGDSIQPLDVKKLKDLGPK